MFKLSVVTITLWLITILAMPTKAVTVDPTRPPLMGSPKSSTAGKQTVTPRWVLSSTLVSRDRRAAIINDRVVVAGDMISGAKVIEIQPMQVTLHAKGKQITLVLLDKNIKTPSRLSDLQEGQK